MTKTPEAIRIPESAPVFPLPDVVFFPHTVLPLHIFEPRYREMIARALEADSCITMALLRPGWEADYEGNPAYHDVGCLGRITDLTRTQDGRYLLKLAGLRKVALGGLVGDSSFRTARIRPIDETVPDDLEPSSHDDLVRLLGICAILAQEIAEKTFPIVSIKEGLPYEAAVNSICFHVGLPPEVKQALLELDDVRERCLRVTVLLENHLQEVLLSRSMETEECGEAVN